MSSTLEELSREYFSSLSPLASKFLQDCDSVRNAYGREWEGLEVERQEQLINEYIIKSDAIDKYTDPSLAGLPECFPVLKIKSGEKVIVDFEHEDGWTWTDEHSAPFSWRSRSQQDLRLSDIVEGGGEGGKPRGGGGVSSGVGGVSPGDVEDDRTEVHRMFEKFGIRVDSDSTDERSDRSSVLQRLSGAESVTNRESVLSHQESQVSHQPSESLKIRQAKDKRNDSVFDDANDTTEKTHETHDESLYEEIPDEEKDDDDVKEIIYENLRDSGGDRDERSDRDLRDSMRSERDLGDSMRSTGDERDGGVFIEMVGESSTDDAVRTGGSTQHVITSQPQPANTYDVIASEDQESAEATAAVTKSGFDFLDNW